MAYMGITNPMNVLEDVGLYRGEFKNFKIELTNERGERLPIDSIEVKFKICDIQDSDIVYVEKTGVPSLAEESVSDIILETADTEDLQMSKYQYIVEMIYETGNKSIGKGYITIL